MAANLILAPEIESDISGAYGWYEQQRPGLGEEFLGAVDACLHAVTVYGIFHTARDPAKWRQRLR